MVWSRQYSQDWSFITKATETKRGNTKGNIAHCSRNHTSGYASHRNSRTSRQAQRLEARTVVGEARATRCTELHSRWRLETDHAFVSCIKHERCTIETTLSPSAPDSGWRQELELIERLIILTTGTALQAASGAVYDTTSDPSKPRCRHRHCTQTGDGRSSRQSG